MKSYNSIAVYWIVIGAILECIGLIFLNQINKYPLIVLIIIFAPMLIAVGIGFMYVQLFHDST